VQIALIVTRSKNHKLAACCVLTTGVSVQSQRQGVNFPRTWSKYAPSTPGNVLFLCILCSEIAADDNDFPSLHFAWVVDDAKCIAVTRVCVSVCLSVAACLHYCTDPDVTWGSGRECPVVVHNWGICNLRFYGNITQTQNVSECMLVLALCLV